MRAELTLDSADATRVGRLRSVTGLRGLAVFVAFLLIVLATQRASDAPGAAFGAFPDEPAHYIGGLLVHDYMSAAAGESPIAYARNYYLYLPYFAIGVWPPLFYAIEAGWAALFGVTRESLLWMIALCGAGLATLLYSILKKCFDEWTAAAGGAMLLFVPAVQWSACVVMVDLACSLFALAAIVFFLRFVEHGWWWDSALFGAFCGLGLLTKNSTYFTVLIPPVLIAGTGRWDLLRRRAVWAGPVIAACIYGPWLAVSKPFLLLGTHGLELPGFFGALANYAQILWEQLSFVLPLGAAGVAALVLSKRRGIGAVGWGMLAILAALPVSIFVARVPVQSRLLVLGYAALIFLTAELFRAVLGPRRAAPLMGVCLAVYGVSHWKQFQAPPENDIRRAVAFVQSRDGGKPGAVIVPSGREGPWIAEFAQFEGARPARILVRPTKIFGTEDWNGTNWKTFYGSAGEMNSLLLQLPVKYCILEGPAAREYPHDRLLQEVLEGNPAGWRLVFRGGGNGSAYRVFENRHWTAVSEAIVHRELQRAFETHYPAVAGRAEE